MYSYSSGISRLLRTDSDQTNEKFMTTYQFHFPASYDATLTIALPKELQGEPLKIVVEQAPTKSPVQDLLDYCTKSASPCTDEELDNERYEYLKEKYR